MKKERLDIITNEALLKIAKTQFNHVSVHHIRLTPFFKFKASDLSDSKTLDDLFERLSPDSLRTILASKQYGLFQFMAFATSEFHGYANQEKFIIGKGVQTYCDNSLKLRRMPLTIWKTFSPAALTMGLKGPALGRAVWTSYQASLNQTQPMEDLESFDFTA